MDDRERRANLQRFKDIERRMPKVRLGVVTATSPLSVALGDSDTAYTSVRVLDGVSLAVNDVVSALLFGNDLLVLGRPGSGAGGIERLQSMALQPGVYAAGDLMVTASSNLTLAYAAGRAVVASPTSNLSATVNVSAGTVTLGTAHATLPRIDQIVVSHLGVVSVLGGTATSGATLNNRTGAATLSAGYLRLADVLVAAADTAISNSEIRDRRPWARGVNYFTAFNNGFADKTTTSGSFVDVDTTNLSPRFEFSGVPVEVLFRARVQHSTTSSISLGVARDGIIVPGTESPTQLVTGAPGETIVSASRFTPSAGSSVLKAQWLTSAATATMKFASNDHVPIFAVREIVAQNSANNTTTSG